MNTFETYVAPRIVKLESYLASMPRRTSHALEHDDFRRLQRLADAALDAQDRLRDLRALEGQPDTMIVSHLAYF
jgi:hypothetical protein